MLDVFCSDFEGKRDRLRTCLEGSGFLYRHSILKSLSLLDGTNESQEFELLQVKIYYRDDIQRWEHLRTKWTVMSVIEGSQSLKYFFKTNLMAAGLFQRYGRDMWDINQTIAIKSFLRASTILGECIGIAGYGPLLPSELASEKEKMAKKKQSARKGGVSKAELYLPVKEETIRLLHQYVPTDGGWKNKTVAAKAIEADLVAFVQNLKSQNKNLDLNEEDITTVVKRWERNDERVKAAFEDTVKQKIPGMNDSD
ncbi:hypothetical protein [Klebsiella oxytoca]|uniref:Uncharacterized protein n=1 Tax=Klebsiella oxytoca TaxID=571 RepID=A0A6B8MY16_KLEOX|nr:hypothetical protein [Klebsiella oxytoca]QGN39263.1 hypothetical protein GJ746_19050 [Klebsiella oxytoca]